MLRIGIIGTDQDARQHTTIILGSRLFEITGCFSQQSRESMLFAREYRLVSYSSLDALFTYSDAIDIASDIPDLYAVAERSLAALKHVYIGHPHRLQSKQVETLSRLAEEAGVVLQLNARYNYCAAYKALASAVATPQRIKLHHQLAAPDISAAQEVLPHDLAFISGLQSGTLVKIDLKSVTAERFQFMLSYDNGNVATISVQAVELERERIEVELHTNDLDIKADVFASTLLKHYRQYEVDEAVTLEEYSERDIYKGNLSRFAKALDGDTTSRELAVLGSQYFAATDMMMERSRQLLLSEVVCR